MNEMTTMKEWHDYWIPPQEDRSLFSDGWRSAAHFTLGFGATTNPDILKWFALYELLPIHTNPQYSLLEFGVGYLFGTIQSNSREGWKTQLP